MKLPAGHVEGHGIVRPTGYGGLGERLLKGMGWEKGQGLGKEGQGLKAAIEVKKKEDTIGVGGTASWNWEEKWWEQAFDSAAKTVDKSDSSDSSDSSDDDEEAAAPGSVNRDGTLTSASRDELKLMKSLSRGGRLAAGRFGGRDAKMERIRAQESKAAAEAATKLGLPSNATTAGQDRASDRSDTTSEAQVPMKGKKDKKSSKKRNRENKEIGGGDGGDASSDEDKEECKPKRIVIEPHGCGPSEPAIEFKPTPSLGWWGAKMFKSAGSMGGIEEHAKAKTKKKSREAFDEDEQARIYNTAQAGKTHGKVGLGQSTGTVKVGGVKWSGQKVTFEDDVGNADGNEDGNAKLKAVGSTTGLDEIETINISNNLSGMKWKKLIARALEAAPEGELKLKALRQHVHASVVEKVGDKVVKSEVHASIESVIARSSKFMLKGKVVSLQK